MTFPYIITIWHDSLEGLGAFAAENRFGDNLVTVLPDTGKQHGVWAVYRVTGDQLTTLRAIPRLTWR